LKAIVFDLDDTLYPEESYVLSGFRAVAAHAAARIGWPAEQALAELSELHRAGVRGDTFNRWLQARAQDSPELVAELIAVYRGHKPCLEPFPGVLALLAGLRSSYRLGLVSDGYLQVQQAKLEALGLEPYLDAVVFSDSLGRASWKPSPIAFEAVLARLGVTAREAVYVADNPAKDFLGSRRLGMHGLRLRTPGCEHAAREPPTREHAPDGEIASLAELETYLGSLEDI
jgi:putative hydrolase of the HAD superfamily